MAIDGSSGRKVALITGVTGQDGAYLAEFCSAQGYEVHGIKRRSSPSTPRASTISTRTRTRTVPFVLHYGDMTDATNLIRIVQEIQPTRSTISPPRATSQVSFETPEYTANADALGTLRLLEAIRILGLEKLTRFYQASTSDSTEGAGSAAARDDAVLSALPYARRQALRLLDHCELPRGVWHARLNGILFNHESPTRGETFVTRKITRAVARIKLGLETRLYLGNLDAKRDWGHARDYVSGMWKIAQQPEPDDYVLATGEMRSVREFVELAFAEVGRTIRWSGTGVDEVGIDQASGDTVVRVDPTYFRPTEVELLIGDASKARRNSAGSRRRASPRW